MTFRLPLLALAAAAMLSACASPAAMGPEPTVTLRGSVGLPAPGLRLQAVDPLKAYDATDVSKVEIWLARGTEAYTSLGQVASTSAAIEITNLRMDTTYKVRLQAYKGTERIDTEDDACVTEVQTTKATTVEGLKFKLALEDQTFAGTSKGSIELTEGELTDTTAAPQLVQD